MSSNVKRSALYVLAIIMVIWGTIEWGSYHSGEGKLQAVPVFAAAGPAASGEAKHQQETERIANEKLALAEALAAYDRETNAASMAPTPAPLTDAAFAGDGSGHAGYLSSPSPTPSVGPAQEAKLQAAAASAPATVHASVYQPGAKPVIIPVLNYHSVTIDPGNIVVISPDKLAEQMEYLDQNGYTPLSLNDFTLMLERRKELPSKPVLLTFDDGYTDNVLEAMPILKKHKFPATLFMSPGMVGVEGYLDWEQVRTLHEAGWDIQPHGMTHPSLPKLTSEEQAYQINEARKQIEAQIGVSADVFCYPYGHYNEQTLRILKEAGFRYAFTIDQGKTTSSQHPYKLKRIFVNGEEALSSLVHKLTKW